MTLDVATVVKGTGAHVVRLSGGTPTDGELLGSDLVRAFTEVTIDSRVVSQGALFVALPGSRVDGHKFVSQALAAGARGALVTHVPEMDLPKGETRYLFVVPDVTAALGRLATFWRDIQPAHVIGITGSVGKTTTKDLVAAVLATRWPVLKSEANLNTEIGMPLMLLRLRSEHLVGVFEMGLHERGDIAYLASLAHADTGMVTNVHPIHLERMGSIEAIAREKSTLVEALRPDGMAVLNADDPWTMAMARSSTVAHVTLCGTGEHAALRATDIESRGIHGISFSLRAEGREFQVRSGVPGVHAVLSLLYAAAAARQLGMEWREVIDALEAVRLESRQRLVPLAPDLLLIDDAYNASPPSVRAALSLLASTEGTRIAVLGDMLELGPSEDDDHRKIGEEVARSADWLVTRGTRARGIATGAEAAGMSAERIVCTEDNREASEATARLIDTARRSGAQKPRIRRQAASDTHDVSPINILVKGSRGMRMEDVVAALREEQW
jgi:UDP-N-acetylmuramoyl-tripeptide--D-alanyl-D-alanine ligase